MYIVQTPTGVVDTRITLDECSSSSSMQACTETPNVDFKPKEERTLPFPPNLTIAHVSFSEAPESLIEALRQFEENRAKRIANVA